MGLVLEFGYLVVDGFGVLLSCFILMLCSLKIFLIGFYFLYEIYDLVEWVIDCYCLCGIGVCIDGYV